MRDTFGDAWDLLFTPPIAHRGLWAPAGYPENSLGAFKAACIDSYGIELDVQLTADGEAVVFHDATLERMTGRQGRVRDHTAEDLGNLRLSGSDEGIPTLADALALIGHGAMVYIEIKSSFGQVGRLERRVHEVLIDHNGPTCIIGFNPYSLAWFADRHPKVMRGLNSHAYRDFEAGRLAPEVVKSYARLEHVSIAKPHFLSLGLDLLPSTKAAALRDKGMPVIAWTARKPEQWEAVKPHCDNLLFEGWRA